MSNNLSDLVAEYITVDSTGVADIISFAESSWGMGAKLTAVQKVVLKAMYRIPLDTTKVFQIYDNVKDKFVGEYTEKSFMKWLYDTKRCNYADTPDREIKELVLVCGRRAGKSVLGSCIAAYEIYKLIKLKKPAEHYGKRSQSTVCVINVAPNDKEAAIIFDFVKTAIDHCPFLKNRIDRSTQESFSLYTDEDIENGKNKSSIEFIIGGCSSTGIRGHDAILVMMDEMAFFLANGGRFSGDEVYKALSPSCKSFKGDGKIVCMSSPYARYGKFYDMYNTGMAEENSQTLVFKCYSTMMNPDMFNSDELKTEKRRNPKGFIGEYGAEFSDSVSSWIDDEEEFMRCVDKFYIPPKNGKFGNKYYLGIDLAGKNDGVGMSVVHEEDGIYTLDYADVWFSGSSDVWEIDSSMYKTCDKYKNLSKIGAKEIIYEIQRIISKYGIKDGVYDQWCGSAMEEHFLNAGINCLTQYNFNASASSEMYEVVKRLYSDGFVRLYNHPVLIPELLMLEAELTGDRTGKKVSVEAPNIHGIHDDISESFVRSVWWAHTKRIERGGGKYKNDNAKKTLFVGHVNERAMNNFNTRDLRNIQRMERLQQTLHR